MGKKSKVAVVADRVVLSPDQVQERRTSIIRRLAGKKWLDAGAPGPETGRQDEFWYAAETEYEDVCRKFGGPLDEPCLPVYDEEPR